MKTKISGGEFLVGRKIIEVGVTNRNNGYIKLDDGKTLYLDSSELEEVE